MPAPVISIRQLTKSYGNRIAVNNLSLDIAPGAVYGFLGPNGAGKTTTIRMLLGLVAPTSGTARICGHDILRERAAIAKRVGAIVEMPAFYSYLTGAQNLRVLAYTSGAALPNARMTELVELVGLRGREHERVQGYSMGMKQRLGIAATLVAQPDILFLDEPTNGLDPLGMIEMRTLLARLGAEGYTIFLSSHLLREVEQVCTDVTILHHGVVQLQGRVSELLAADERYVLEVAPIDRAQAIIQQHPGWSVAVRADGWLQVRCTHAEAPQVVQALLGVDVLVYQIVRQQLTLEELFLTTVPAGDATAADEGMEQRAG